MVAHHGAMHCRFAETDQAQRLRLQDFLLLKTDRVKMWTRISRSAAHFRTPQ